MNRFKWWAMLLFTSVLVWAAAAIISFEDFGKIPTDRVVLLSVYTISILLALSGMITSTCSGGTMKAWTETVLIFLNLIYWVVVAIATLVSSTSKLIPVGELVVQSSDEGNDYNIRSPNIYFFSFGSLAITIYLLSSWLKEYFFRDENALTTTQWTFLAASGFLVMLTGFSLLENSSCTRGRYYSCPLTIFSILAGLLSGVTSCLLIPWRSAPLKCQAEFALILVITWAAAIATLTFGAGPAVSINTMYFGIYISFSIALNILVTTLYADSVLEASPFSQVEFGMTESERAKDEIGMAGFLNMAYDNMTKSHSQPVLDHDDDPRNTDASLAILFDTLDGSSSLLGSDSGDAHSNSLLVGRDTSFNKNVIVGKRNLGRIEIWFILMVESIVSLAVFYGLLDGHDPIRDQWIVFAPILSIAFCFIGWIASTVQMKWANILEGILIISCITTWIRGLIAVTYYFRDDSDAGVDTNKVIAMETMTANQLFMSYGSFFTSLYLLTNWSNASVTTTDWIFSFATSGTVFGVLYILDEEEFKECFRDFGKCGQLEVLIMAALGSTLLSLVMVFVSFLPPCGRFMPFIHFIIGTIVLVCWCVTSYFIVFRKDGVGSQIGPAFFACWGVLFFSVDIVSTNMLLLCKIRSDQGGEEDANLSLSISDGDECFEDEQNTHRPASRRDGDKNFVREEEIQTARIDDIDGPFVAESVTAPRDTSRADIELKGQFEGADSIRSEMIDVIDCSEHDGYQYWNGGLIETAPSSQVIREQSVDSQNTDQEQSSTNTTDCADCSQHNTINSTRSSILDNSSTGTAEFLDCAEIEFAPLQNFSVQENMLDDSFRR